MKLMPCAITQQMLRVHQEKQDRHIKAFNLDHGYQLHRFVNACGDGYSAIYNCIGEEEMSVPRLFENRMIDAFKRQHRFAF